MRQPMGTSKKTAHRIFVAGKSQAGFSLARVIQLLVLLENEGLSVCRKGPFNIPPGVGLQRYRAGGAGG
jgi:hypothetical protein